MSTIDIIKPNATQFITESLLRSPLTAVVTAVSTSAVELKAGGSALADRTYLRVKNLDPVLRARIGGSTVTEKTNGTILEPLATAEFYFNKSEAVALYACSTGYAIKLEVTES